MKVKEVMTRDPLTIDPEAPLGTAMDVMRRKRIRHLPVVDDAGRLMGIITDRDLRQASFGPAPAAPPPPRAPRPPRRPGRAGGGGRGGYVGAAHGEPPGGPGRQAGRDSHRARSAPRAGERVPRYRRGPAGLPVVSDYVPGSR